MFSPSLGTPEIPRAPGCETSFRRSARRRGMRPGSVFFFFFFFASIATWVSGISWIPGHPVAGAFGAFMVVRISPARPVPVFGSGLPLNLFGVERGEGVYWGRLTEAKGCSSKTSSLLCTKLQNAPTAVHTTCYSHGGRLVRPRETCLMLAPMHVA